MSKAMLMGHSAENKNYLFICKYFDHADKYLRLYVEKQNVGSFIFFCEGGKDE